MNTDLTQKMLHLKLPTDPRWVDIAEKNIEDILVDHAYCEQKAATSCISLIVLYPDKEKLVDVLTPIVAEEWGHFERVMEQLKKRGYKLGKGRKDEYVNQLMAFIKTAGLSKEAKLMDQLLLCALIEARSCERFKVLSENIKDPELAKFYRDLMISEAGHYTTFLGFARKYVDNFDVDKRWQEWIDFEGELITNYGKNETVHG